MQPSVCIQSLRCFGGVLQVPLEDVGPIETHLRKGGLKWRTRVGGEGESLILTHLSLAILCKVVHVLHIDQFHPVAGEGCTHVPSCTIPGECHRGPSCALRLSISLKYLCGTRTGYSCSQVAQLFSTSVSAPQFLHIYVSTNSCTHVVMEPFRW